MSTSLSKFYIRHCITAGFRSTELRALWPHNITQREFIHHPFKISTLWRRSRPTPGGRERSWASAGTERRPWTWGSSPTDNGRGRSWKSCCLNFTPTTHERYVNSEDKVKTRNKFEIFSGNVNLNSQWKEALNLPYWIDAQRVFRSVLVQILPEIW